ncbi:MAG TPA: hypothetical protein VFL56_02600, partial [Solirubrobacterales bacterium]|nr:hypothetical protein [Solirubrobacterales bacterium]
DAAKAWFLGGPAPPPGTVAFQVPVTFELGGVVIQTTTPDIVARAHSEGFAWHEWFDSRDFDGPSSWRQLIDYCVDGIMTSRPVRLERTLRSHPAPARCARR